MATAWKAYLVDADTRSAQRTPVQTMSGGTVTATSTLNDGSTILGGGTPASAKNNMFTVINSARDGRPAGTSVTLSATDDMGTEKSVSAGTFAGQTAGSYIGQGITTSLAGVANTFLTNFGASTGKYKGIHKNVTDNDGLQVTRGWEYSSGQFSSLPDALTVIFPEKDGTTTSDISAIDLAATPTRAIPGKLVYHEGDTNDPTVAQYSAITG